MFRTEGNRTTYCRALPGEELSAMLAMTFLKKAVVHVNVEH
jgi:hypothetical protein